MPRSHRLPTVPALALAAALAALVAALLAAGACTSDVDTPTSRSRGQIEVEVLAASFDAMLDRLVLAAQSQRLLVEEASHELRTPLAVLSTNAEVLLAHPEPTLDHPALSIHANLREGPR